MSELNEGKTEGDIAECGARLAEEVVTYINDSINTAPSGSGYRLGRLSFVAHSMGGLFVRAALTEPIMQPYLRHLYTLVTAATPHCGYMFSSHSLFVSTGRYFS